MIKQFITAIENIRFEIHLCLILFEFNHTEFFTSHGNYFLKTTLQVPGVGFSVAGLDRAKLSRWSVARALPLATS